MTNDNKIKVMKKRRILYYLIILFGILTIVLSIFALVEKLNPLPALIAFLIEAILTKMREKTTY